MTVDLYPEVVLDARSFFRSSGLRQTTVQILCEGAACNGGLSAEERTRRHRVRFHDTGDHKTVEHAVTMELQYQPHVWVSGAHYFACTVCGHQRIYG